MSLGSSYEVQIRHRYARPLESSPLQRIHHAFTPRAAFELSEMACFIRADGIDSSLIFLGEAADAEAYQTWI